MLNQCKYTIRNMLILLLNIYRRMCGDNMNISVIMFLIRETC